MSLFLAYTLIANSKLAQKKGELMIVVAIAMAILALVAVTFISGLGTTLGPKA